MSPFSQCRQQAGLSAQEAGELLKLSVETIAEYESGARAPTAREMQVLKREIQIRIGFSLGHAAESVKNETVESRQIRADSGGEMQKKIPSNSAIKLTPSEFCAREGGREVGLKACESHVEVLDAQDVFAAFEWIRARNLRPTVTMLDPWYNKGVGGVIPDSEYDSFIDKLLEKACLISRHVYLWGFPEILATYVRRVPTTHRLVAWLTWYYKNNPSVIRGWRSAQMACLHIAEPEAPLYPQHFLNSAQKQKLADGKLRYMPGPASVIESPLNIGFVGRKEQTGHPAQKPLSVYDKLIRMVTLEGDLIFDPMCGSGTSGVVAKIRNRKAILNDMNSDYVKITRQRLENDLGDLDKKLDLQMNNRESDSAAALL